jgi:hypothetical protein
MQVNSSTAGGDTKAARRREKEQGRSTYRPQSFKELLGDAVESIEHALEDGVNRMEVDFPTLAGDSQSLSSLQTESSAI